MSSLYGYNKLPPVTITSAGAMVVKNKLMQYLCCLNVAEFDRKYRGLYKERHGLVKRSDKPGYITDSSLEPISDCVNSIQYYASQAYHGGYNACFEVGYFPFITFDYDLKNAYPSAMCLIPLVDWENLVQKEIHGEKLTLGMWEENGKFNPFKPFVGCISFNFPKGTKYPCIPINKEGRLIYPLSCEEAYAAGPFIYLALKMGAEITCKTGYFMNILEKEEKIHTRCLANAIKPLVVDRTQAKKDHGNGCLQELILKVIVNSLYGKVSQNVKTKKTWSAFRDEMISIGCSAITNPYIGMMITSIVQVLLIAAQTQLYEKGYHVYSVTTDGFISDCPEDVLKECDLFGMRDFMEESRLFLTDNTNSEMWEIKHVQDDLVNFTTRGNVSLNDKKNKHIIHNGKEYPGVCAHNSFKTGKISDTFADRYKLMKAVVSRTGPLVYEDDKWPCFKEIITKNAPFCVSKETRNIRMDFDMKRKPIKDSFTTDYVEIAGKRYEIVHFDTEPFETVEEHMKYYQAKESCKVLRTMNDWKKFWLKIESEGHNKVRNMEWSILNSCITKYRMGECEIPVLDNLETIADKCKWIECHNNSGKQFTKTDWQNAGRKERAKNVLPDSVISKKLTELQNDF